MKRRLAAQLTRIARRLDPQRPAVSYNIRIGTAADVAHAERRLAAFRREQYDALRAR